MVCDKGEGSSNCWSPQKSSLTAAGENVSRVLSVEQPEGTSQFMPTEDLSVVSEVVLDSTETQKDAREDVSVEPPLAEKGKEKISGETELLPRSAPEGIKPHATFCKQFAVTEGCGSELIELVQNESLPVASNSVGAEKFGSVSSCQSFLTVYKSTDFVLERSRVEAIPTKTNTASVTAKQLFTHPWEGRCSIVNQASPSVCQIEFLNEKKKRKTQAEMVSFFTAQRTEG